MRKIRLAIVDDEKFIRESLKIILSIEDDIEVCGLCEDGESAYKLCMEKSIDVVLMDIRMPGVDGVTGTRNIKRSFPKVKILVLTTFDDDEYIFDALRAGASGYLLKDTSPDIIIEAIKGVYKGSVIMHPKIAEKIISGSAKANKYSFEEIKNKYGFSNREVSVMESIGNGLSNKEISNELHLSEGTVKNYITEILFKLKLRDRTQIALFVKDNLLK